MDDLKLLRDLGAELEHGPPPTLVRQRTRYLQDRPRRRWNAWWTAGLVAVATVCAVAVPTVLVSPRHLANLAGPPAGGEVRLRGQFAQALGCSRIGIGSGRRVQPCALSTSLLSCGLRPLSPSSDQVMW